MGLKFNLGGRPSSHWNDYVGPIKPDFSNEHEHEFGQGYDIYYRDKLGNVQARLDGLRQDEAEFLKKKWGI